MSLRGARAERRTRSEVEAAPWQSGILGNILLTGSLRLPRRVGAPRSDMENIMIIGKVIGTIVTTISHPHYKDRRLLVIQPLLVEGEPADEDFIALDNSQAGIGDTVLVNREGNGARQALKNPDAAVISVIVGIVDSVYLEIEAS